jgi:hypothetical protein
MSHWQADSSVDGGPANRTGSNDTVTPSALERSRCITLFRWLNTARNWAFVLHYTVSVTEHRSHLGVHVTLHRFGDRTPSALECSCYITLFQWQNTVRTWAFMLHHTVSVTEHRPHLSVRVTLHCFDHRTQSASITWIQSLNILQNHILICYCHSQMCELYHMFEAYVSYLYVMILPCSLVTRQQHILSFLCFLLDQPL